MEGRRTGTPGIRRAADHLVRELERMGAEPAGAEGFLQAYPLTRTTRAVDLRLSGGDAAVDPEALQLISGLAGLPGGPRSAAAAPVVYGGHVVASGQSALSPEELRGVALILRLSPAPGTAPGTPPLYDPGALVAPGSPLGALIVVTEGIDLEQLRDHAASSDHTLALGEAPPASSAGGPPVFLISRAAAEALLGTPLDGAAARGGLGTLDARVRESRDRVTAWNVVARVTGADPRRSGQMVALGAHYDHVGIGVPVSGDSIYNGADDDASGTAALLEIARGYASQPRSRRPARSLLFVWHSGEEDGLLGSGWFTRNPTVPRDSIVAHVNIDMIGRNHPDSVHVIGSRRISTSLGATVEAVNARQAAPMVLDYTLDAPGHPEQLYCRSDHYSYARFGIPVAFFTTGLHEDYHEPSDEAETLDYRKLARVSTLISGVLRALADAPEPPPVDRPVPPIENPCTQ